jgi:hypothetical protein
VKIKGKILFGDKSYGPGDEEALEAERGGSLAYLSEQGAIEGYEAASPEPASSPQSQDKGGAPARKARKGGKK